MEQNIAFLCILLINPWTLGAQLSTTSLSYEETTIHSLQEEWITDPVVKAVPVGSSFNLTCQLSEHGTVVWQLNNRPLGFGDVLFQTKTKERFSLSEINDGSLLEVSNAQKDDGGIYKCQSTDVQDLTHIVSVLDKPELNVTCLGKIGLLQWRIDQPNDVDNEQPQPLNQTQPSVHKVLVQRSRRDSDEWETLQEVGGGNAETKVQLLIRDQKFRMQWTDSLGVEWTSNESPSTLCTGPQDVPLSNPTDIQASLLQDDNNLALIIYWTGIPEDHYMGDNVFYRIYYKELAHEEWTTMDFENNDTKYFKYKTYISPESEDPTYSIQIQAGNVIGLSGAAMSPILVDVSKDDTSSNSVLPTFISRPQLVVAKEGDTVTFKCEHQAPSEYSSVWYKNSSDTPLAIMGFRMTDDTRYVPQGRDLQITNAQNSDSGTYVCKIQMNPVASLSHVLIIGDTIPILRVDVTCSDTEPQALVKVELCMGEIYNRRVRTYRHYYDDYEDVRSCRSFTGLEQHILEQLEPYDITIKVTTTLQQNAGGFEQTVTNNTTRIRLHPALHYGFYASSRNIYGQSQYFKSDTTCSTAPDVPWRNPSPVTLTRTFESIVVLWQPLEPLEYHSSGFGYRVAYTDGNFNNTADVESPGFIITEFDPESTYTVTVTSFNDKGDCNQTATPVISYPPNVKEDRENCFPSFYPATRNTNISVTASVGGNTSLSCNNAGTRSMMWRRQPSKNIVAIRNVTLLETTRVTVEANGDLSIRGVEPQDLGYYECVAFQDTYIIIYMWNLISQE